MLRIWFKAKKDESEMAKRKKPKGRSVKNGNAPSPYLKYGKQPYQYSETYKKNYLKNGILHRDGKPVFHRDENRLQAAE